MLHRNFLGLSLCLAAAGCGGVANVKGTVSYKGALLDHGSITAIATNGTHQAAIQSDGSFELTGVALGKAKFHVVCQDEKFTKALIEATEKAKDSVAQDKPPTKEGGRLPGKLNVAGGSGKLGNPKNLIPAKYGDTTKEILTYEVVRGENKYDIKLDP